MECAESKHYKIDKVSLFQFVSMQCCSDNISSTSGNNETRTISIRIGIGMNYERKIRILYWKLGKFCEILKYFEIK